MVIMSFKFPYPSPAALLRPKALTLPRKLSLSSSPHDFHYFLSIPFSSKFCNRFLIKGPPKARLPGESEILMFDSSTELNLEVYQDSPITMASSQELILLRGFASNSEVFLSSHNWDYPFWIVTKRSSLCDSFVFSSLIRVWLFATPRTVCSPLGSSVHGLLQARMLEWGAISFSRGSSRPRTDPCLLHWQVDSLPLSHQGSLLDDGRNGH